MKLRNKKTGEILDFKTPACMVDEKYSYQYDSLAELNEEWEDYEEPERQYYIDADGTIKTSNAVEDEIPDEMLAEMKVIGNYFETEEEAELVVEKLKALKRLKDKGFGFKFYVRSWGYTSIQTLKITADIAFYDNIDEDLGLLFGDKDD